MGEVLLAVSHRASFWMASLRVMLDEQFHVQYHSEAAEAGITDLA
jgi:hypothetical protein